MASEWIWRSCTTRTVCECIFQCFVTAREASLESNLESSDGTNIIYNLYFWRKQPFVFFVKVKLSHNISRSDFISSNRWNWAVFVSFIYIISNLCLALLDLMLLLSVNRSVLWAFKWWLHHFISLKNGMATAISIPCLTLVRSNPGWNSPCCSVSYRFGKLHLNWFGNLLSSIICSNQ